MSARQAVGFLRARVRRLRSFARDVSGESAPRLIGVLVEHLAVDLEGLALAERVVRGNEGARAAESEIRAIEHRGDDLRRRLVAELSAAFVTPLDPEDLFRLSRSIDDVLDNIRDFIREWSLYLPEEERNVVSLLASLRTGLEELSAAVAGVGSRPGDVAGHLLDAKRSANRVRRRFEDELARLFLGEVTSELLKQRELLRRLDIVGLRLCEAVDILFDALVKRGDGFVPPFAHGSDAQGSDAHGSDALPA